METPFFTEKIKKEIIKLCIKYDEKTKHEKINCPFCNIEIIKDNYYKHIKYDNCTN